MRHVRVPFAIGRPGARPFDVVGFGQNSVDLLTVVAEFPEPNSKQRLQRFTRLPGGEIATAMVACGRLGWSARYVGSFGSDDLGTMARECLVREGVDVSAGRIVPGATNRFAVILVDARTGDRTVLWDRHPALTLTPADMVAEVVTSGRMLLVDCQDTPAAGQAARIAHEAGIPTVIDVERVRPGTADLLQHIDAIVAAQSFPTEFTGYEDLGRALEAMAREFGTPVVAVTLGESGSLARCAGREIRTLGFPIACVDSTGAGDAFRGGFVAGCLLTPDGDIEDVLQYANAVAALNCRALGAMTALPRAADVAQLLQSRSPM